MAALAPPQAASGTAAQRAAHNLYMEEHTMTRAEMPIFTRTFDLLAWLLPATNHFPRSYRHSFTRRLLDAAFDLSESLLEANLRYGEARLERLARADEALDKLRHYLRLAARLNWLGPGQYEHVAAIVAEIGRLLGGWRKVSAGRR